VSASRCNMLIRDVDSKFDGKGSPVGYYELALDKPYERAICIKLLHLVASNSYYSFVRCAYDSKPSPASASQSGSSGRAGAPVATKPISIPSSASELHLKAILSDTRMEYLDSFELEQLKKLQDIERAAIDIDFAQQVFRGYDKDNSGALDRNEIKELLSEVGLVLEGEAFDQAMDICDVDKSGELDVSVVQIVVVAFKVSHDHRRMSFWISSGLKKMAQAI
jgi:hypothetical protein